MWAKLNDPVDIESTEFLGNFVNIFIVILDHFGKLHILNTLHSSVIK